jgi:hypothetical protein
VEERQKVAMLMRHSLGTASHAYMRNPDSDDSDQSGIESDSDG